MTSSAPPRRSAIAELELDGAREVALRAVPNEIRPRIRALWQIDLAFADVLWTTLTPQLGEIRMAWWRERLLDLDKGLAPPREPRLQAVAEFLIPAGVTGAELAQLEDCWLDLLYLRPWGVEAADAFARRGAILFGIAARLLGREPTEAESLGAAWSVAEAAQYFADEESREVLGDRARTAIAALPEQRLPVELGPLTMITVRRVYDFLHRERRGWHRGLFVLRYILSGRIPRS